MLVIERLFPATKLPRVPGWWVRAIAINFFQIATVLVAGVTWNRWLQGWSLFQCHLAPDWLATALTYVFSTLVFYWWHRIRHESRFWWRVAHQIHHSASRIEILASFYKHPFEIVLNSVLTAIIVYPIMGCSPVQGGYYTIIIAVGEMLYHWNIHTPRWCGHWFQRPESHRIHHQRDRHTKNYSDLPIWDKIWGTFSNPTNGDRIECGFANEKETQLVEMLKTQEVDTQKQSDPLDWRIACLGCEKRHRCDKG